MKISLMLSAWSALVALAYGNLTPLATNFFFFRWQDKLYHLLGFGLVGLLFFLAYSNRRKVFWGMTLVAFAVENGQRFIEGRHYDPWDLVANGLGILLALATVILLPRRKEDGA